MNLHYNKKNKMIYIIKRASTDKDESPCEEAIKIPFENWQTRCTTEDSFNERFSLKQGTWKSIGKNHTITKEGYITRQLNDEMLWSIEVNSLEDLDKLIEKYGSIIIEGPDNKNKAPTITIYDYYME